MNEHEWLKLLDEKEEELREQAEKLYISACGDEVGNSNSNTLILDDDGTIRKMYASQNTTDGGVWNGTAKEICDVIDMNVFEWVDDICQDVKNFLQNSGNDGQHLKDYEAYCEENEITGHKKYTTWTLKAFSPDLYQTYLQEVIDWCVGENFLSWFDTRMEDVRRSLRDSIEMNQWVAEHA